MNCEDLIRKALVTFGYDGLYSAQEDCACHYSDLAPCGEICAAECKPGVLYTSEDVDAREADAREVDVYPSRGFQEFFIGAPKR